MVVLHILCPACRQGSCYLWIFSRKEDPESVCLSKAKFNLFWWHKSHLTRLKMCPQNLFQNFIFNGSCEFRLKGFNGTLEKGSKNLRGQQPGPLPTPVLSSYGGVLLTVILTSEDSRLRLRAISLSIYHHTTPFIGRGWVLFPPVDLRISLMCGRLGQLH